MSDSIKRVESEAHGKISPNDVSFKCAPASSRIKFWMDKVLALTLLIGLAPIFLIIIVAIRMDTPGPVIFRQLRFGLNGAEIIVHKFRTMHIDMTDRAGAKQATYGDIRVTRLGALLRRTCLDELPQLWDVLCGRMSLVGPRPHPIGMTVDGRLAADIIYRYNDRLRTRPGITGLAQIRGNRGPVPDVDTCQERISLDNEYIENWSFLMDLKILLFTVVVPFQKGCY